MSRLRRRHFETALRQAVFVALAAAAGVACGGKSTAGSQVAGNAFGGGGTSGAAGNESTASSGSSGESNGPGGSASGNPAGGGTAGTGAAGSDASAGSVGSAGTSGSTAGCPPPPTPAHRPVATACQPDGNGATGAACALDSDCQADGGIPWCLGGHCASDQCLSDADCPAGQACGCSSLSSGRAANTCVPSGCRVDSDCSSGLCSPTYVNNGFCQTLSGYQCRGPSDQCVSADYCSPANVCGASGSTDSAVWLCNYSPTAGHWTCSNMLFYPGMPCQ